MNNLSGDSVTLSQLVRTEEHGLNVNRLLFAKFLVMTGRINEGTGSNHRGVFTPSQTMDESGTDEPATPTLAAVAE